jgi:hypothetical protein
MTFAGLGAFHGLNPAMGWLFAVALGLHRKSGAVVLASLVPIAIGHAASVAAVVAAVLSLGLVVETQAVSRLAGVVLIAWAVWHALRGHRGRPRVGMQTGMAGLVLWSFLMATAHGAGLMLIPVLLPVCAAASPLHQITAPGSFPIALAALGVHSAAMLATIAVVSITVYEWIGLAFLRTAWINLDLIWILALIVCGSVLLLA